MKKQEKTNIMRILDQHGIPYQSYDYSGTGAVGGTEVAEVLGEDPAHVFKTLVTVGKSGQHYVFDIPVAEELDLKKAAAAVGEKSIAMIRAKELLPLTGYVHGGCSPVGMKKPFPTVFHLTAESLNMVFVSAGRIGSQIEVAPGDLQRIVPFSYADVCVD